MDLHQAARLSKAVFRLDMLVSRDRIPGETLRRSGAATRGPGLFVDSPELNASPENQKVTRHLAGPAPPPSAGQMVRNVLPWRPPGP